MVVSLYLFLYEFFIDDLRSLGELMEDLDEKFKDLTWKSECLMRAY